VTFLTSMVTTRASASTATAAVSLHGSPGLLNAWIDFNQDGMWDDSPGSLETIADDVPVSPGVNLLSYSVPAGSQPGTTFLRARVSTQGGLSPLGEAADGEVEDYPAALIDGDTPGGAAARAALPSTGGGFEITRDGLELVVRQGGGMELFRAPTISVAALDVAGTAGPETITVDFSQDVNHAVRLSVQGGGGADSVAVFCSSNVDKSQIRPFSATVVSKFYTVNLAQVGNITVHGGFEDWANLYDSKSADTARLAPLDAQISNSILGFANRALGIKMIFARSTSGGADVAWLYDGAGADFLKSSSNYAVLYSALGEYQTTAVGFRAMNVVGSKGGYNLVTILASRTYTLTYSRFSLASSLAFGYKLPRAQALYWMKRIALLVDPALGRARDATELAILLRNHIYQVSLYGVNSAGWTANDAYSRYLKVLTHHEPIICQGLQIVYTDLLHAFGLQARYVSMWAADNFNNHASVEVRLGGRWVAMDPTYNVSFIADDGRLLSFAEIRAGIPYRNSLDGMKPKLTPGGWLQIIEGYPISLRTMLHRIFYPALWIGGTGY
jgi:hypothetical protein